MSFKRLKKNLPQLVETRIENDTVGAVIVTAGTIDQKIAVAAGRMSPSELIAACVRSEDGDTMEPEEWNLVLTGSVDLANELMEAINKSILGEGGDLKNS